MNSPDTLVARLLNENAQAYGRTLSRQAAGLDLLQQEALRAGDADGAAYAAGSAAAFRAIARAFVESCDDDDGFDYTPVDLHDNYREVTP